MIETFLKNLSSLFVWLGNFFLVSSFIGLIRNKDFYVKLHTLSMFSIYGINFLLFSIGILSFDPIIFFEMLFVIVVNTLTTLAVINCFFRNAILNGVPYKAKTRDEVVAEQQKEMEENEKINKKNKNINKIKQEKENKENKQNKKTNIAKNSVNNTTNVNKQEDKPVNKSSNKNDAIRKENDELRKKIREQKAILRKKIETIRRNAFVTRKPEEIEKAEKTIYDILTKYNLTEEMLKDDED